MKEQTQSTEESSSGGKPKMTQEQRLKLAEVLDEQLEEELQKLEHSGSKYMDGWTEENWETEMEKHPFFATQNSLDPTKELSPLMKGIQDLKYSPEENTPAELSANYKEDGNFNFKCKKYRLAILAYSEGLRNVNIAMSSFDEMNDQEKKDIATLKAQLITNRAASQYRLGNYRSSLIDCRLALKDMPQHLKAIERAIECCNKLNRHKECMEMCDKGLLIIKPENGQDPDKRKKLQDTRAQAEKRYREDERNKRKEEAVRKKEKAEEQKLLTAIQTRGIKIKANSSEDREKDSMVLMSDIEPCHPAALNKKVRLVISEGGESVLVWPVMFLYPEHGESDFIEEFTESDTLNDHLYLMFDQSEALPWDREGKYRSYKDINVYFEDARCEANPKLITIDTNKSLCELLSCNEHPGVIAGTPTFIVLAKNSKFENDFLLKYK